MIFAVKEKGTIYLVKSVEIYAQNMSEADAVKLDNLAIWKLRGTKDGYVGFEKNDAVADCARYTRGLFKKQINAFNLREHTAPRLRKALEENDLLCENNVNNEAIIVSDGKIYQLIFTGMLMETEGITVCGGPIMITFVRAAWETTEGLPFRERVYEVFRRISISRKGVQFPVSILNTSTGEQEILTFDYEKDVL